MADLHDTVDGGPRPITRDDLEAGFRQLTGEVDEKAEAARSTVLTIGAIAGVGVLLLVFLLGIRRGKRKTTIVEVRRF